MPRKFDNPLSTTDLVLRIQTTKDNDDEKQLLIFIASTCIDKFLERISYVDLSYFYELIPLIDVSSIDISRRVLEAYLKAIRSCILEHPALYYSLAEVIDKISQQPVDVRNSINNIDDILTTLDVLIPDGKKAHLSTEQILSLLQAFSGTVDKLVDANFYGLPKEEIKNPLYKILEEYKTHVDPDIAYQAAYVQQALLRIPSDESKVHLALRRIEVFSKALHHVRGVLSPLKAVTGDFGALIDILSIPHHTIGAYKDIKELVHTKIKPDDWYNKLRITIDFIKVAALQFTSDWLKQQQAASSTSNMIADAESTPEFLQLGVVNFLGESLLSTSTSKKHRKGYLNLLYIIAKSGNAHHWPRLKAIWYLNYIQNYSACTNNVKNLAKDLLNQVRDAAGTISNFSQDKGKRIENDNKVNSIIYDYISTLEGDKDSLSKLIKSFQIHGDIKFNTISTKLDKTFNKDKYEKLKLRLDLIEKVFLILRKSKFLPIYAAFDNEVKALRNHYKQKSYKDSVGKKIVKKLTKEPAHLKPLEERKKLLFSKKSSNILSDYVLSSEYVKLYIENYQKGCELLQDNSQIVIGSDEFARLVQSACYIDKTAFIKDIINDSHTVIYILRPRRFLKSSNLSMLSSFLDVADADADINRKLFEQKINGDKNLYIANQPEMETHQGQYPVIYIDLSTLTENTTLKSFKKEILRNIHDHYTQYSISVDPSIMNNPKDFLLYLMDALYKKYGKRCYVIIDEFDKPVYLKSSDKDHKEIQTFWMKILAKALKGNFALEKAVLTGISRPGGETVESAFNNYRTYSVIENGYSAYFGFTEADIQHFQTTFHLKPDELTNIKQWYGGYQFDDTKIFNPWSTLEYLALIKYVREKKAKENKISVEEYIESETYSAPEPRQHWIKVLTDIRIKQLIEHKVVSLILAKLIWNPNLDHLIQFQDTAAYYPGIEEKSSAEDELLSILVLSGFLTVVSCKEKKYQIKIPNNEVLEYIKSIIKIEEAAVNELPQEISRIDSHENSKIGSNVNTLFTPRRKESTSRPFSQFSTNEKRNLVFNMMEQLIKENRELAYEISLMIGDDNKLDEAYNKVKSSSSTELRLT